MKYQIEINVPYLNFPIFLFLHRYGNPGKGITGMSNRVILNGGLTALRWNRTTISEAPTLNLASSGINPSGKSANVLKTLPPKVSHFYLW